LRRQHGVSIFASLAAFDPQQHALGVDIADFERNDFGGAQPGAVCGAERRPILRPRCRLQQQHDLFGAQHRRQPARVAYDGKPARQIRPVERHREEEAQCCNCAVDAWRLHTDLRLVQFGLASEKWRVPNEL
jgi:hypothetical protein